MNGRLVWISEQEFQDWSYAVDVANLDVVEQACDPILQRYRDAPDPTDAATRAAVPYNRNLAKFIAQDVLSALGVPVEAKP